jgi:site-specific recombinase XerD
MATLNSLFDQFLRERRYLKNVSPKTITWYETSWKSFCATLPSGLAATVINSPDVLTRQHLSAFVVALRDRGVRAVTVRAWLRAINAYGRWLQEEGVIRERGQPSLSILTAVIDALSTAMSFQVRLHVSVTGPPGWVMPTFSDNDFCSLM